MRRTIRIAAVSMLLAAGATWAAADTTSIADQLGVTVTPTKGQGEKKKSGDESACYSLAKQNTGIDPIAEAANQPKSSSGKGAVKGGLLGTGVGILTGHPLRGAAIGAGTGAVAGGAAKKSQKQAKETKLDQFATSFTGCLEGKGYVVSQP